jgi:anthranilate phosphoribosyltransferase
MIDETGLRNFGRLICEISRGKIMTREESKNAYRQVILNLQPELQQGAFLMSHITRVPTMEELAGAWEAMDEFDTAKISCKKYPVICDIVGTGSDSLKTVNCSTPAAFIASACGLPIAKKGARLVTGVSGASDVLETLGIDLDAPLTLAEKSLNQYGICYLPGEKFLKSGWARLIKSMRFTSAFNIIGPLTRPCSRNNRIVIGAYSPEVCDQLIGVLEQIGMEGALAPFGMAEGMDKQLGMDEFSPCGPTRVAQLSSSGVEIYEVTAEDFGFQQIPFEHIKSGSSTQENAQKIFEVLKFKHESELADFFCMNSAAALFISEFADSYADGFAKSKEALSSGRAFEKFQQLKDIQGRGTDKNN